MLTKLLCPYACLAYATMLTVLLCLPARLSAIMRAPASYAAYTCVTVSIIFIKLMYRKKGQPYL